MLLSLVFPVFNEEDAVPRLLEAVRPVLVAMGHDYELVFVDDGSRDGTRRILSQAAVADPRIKIIGFSRNFGHQAAITAGLDFAEGDAVVVMDADLQDPPELLPQMVTLYQQGFDVVSAQRISRDGDGMFKRLTATGFYRLMQTAVDERLPPEVGDFRLFSRAAVEAIRGFREQHRFLRGLVAWLGLKEAIIPFHRQARVAGVTKYPLWKMLKFAWTAISSFSALPLKLSLYGGMILTIFGLMYGVYVVYERFFGTTVPGWSSLVCLQLLFNGATLMSVGLLGDYVARIYEESKRRPLYVVSEAVNLSPATSPPVRGVWVHRAQPPLPLTDVSPAPSDQNGRAEPASGKSQVPNLKSEF